MALTGAGIRPDFWRGRNVLLTGHTGFKGGWAALWLSRMGARVTGLALDPDTQPSLFALAGIARDVESKIADIRDSATTIAAVRDFEPQIVLHLAAQALVRRAARQPLETFATNVIGTANVLEAVRECPSLKAVVVVTSDKVYKNDETGRPFREDDALSGDEPYSASKAAAELVARVYRGMFFEHRGIALGTARGGNVVGGGDFAQDRLVPDIVRASMAGTDVIVRNPDFTRPWQHVLDCVGGYLCYAQALTGGGNVPLALNFGPDAAGSIRVEEVAKTMLAALPGKSSYRHVPDNGPKESRLLALDSTRARRILGWSDCYPGNAGLQLTADWYRQFRDGADMRAVTLAQIDAYMDAQS